MSGHHALAEAMRRHGQTPGNAYSLPRHATVSSYNPNTYAVKVLIQPEGVESNWMPLGSIGVGNGWGVVVGPQLGDQVMVAFPEGDFSGGVVVARLYSSENPPPVVASGEIAIQHSSGSILRFNADGSVSLNTPGNLNVSAAEMNIVAPVNITGNVAITGSTAVTGAITSTTSVTAPVISGTTNVFMGSKSGIAHTHSGVQPGIGNSGAPN